MSVDRDETADELGRAFAALAGAAGALPDGVDLWRAIHEWRERECEDNDRTSPPADMLGLMLEANAVVLDSHERLTRQWQRLMARTMPRIRECLEDYRAEPDPLPERRSALIDEIRNFVGEIGELALDHGRTVKEDLVRLQRELLPRERESEWVTPDRRSRMAKAVRR